MPKLLTKKNLIILGTILLALIVLWLIGSLVLLFRAPQLVFDTTLSKNAKPDFAYQQFFIKNSHNQKLDTWWLPKEGSKDVILYMHGNAGRIITYLPEFNQTANVLSPAYPGYSGSEGQPDTENIYETLDLTIDYLHQKGFKDEQITVWGHSLGGSPSVYAATEYPNLQKVVLVNTFYSIQSMCFPQYSILCAFGGGILNSGKLAPQTVAKIRQFHDPNDKKVPFSEGEKLYAALGSKDKKFQKLKDTDTHVNFNIQDTLKE